LFVSAACFSQKPVLFNGSPTIIGQSVSIFEDVSNQYNIASIIKDKPVFTDSKVQTPNLQLSSSSFWLKFSIKNQSDQQHLILSLEYPTLNLCEFYFRVQGKYRVTALSDDAAFGNRKYKHQNFLFDINLPVDSTATYYLHVKSNEEMVLPLIISTPQKVAEALVVRDFLWGIFIGLIVVMALYNFFIFISTRDNSYLFYVFYVTFIGLTQTSLNGYTYRFIFFNSPVLFHKGLILFPAFAGISAMLFVRFFLHTKKNTPALNRFFTVAITLYSLAIVLRLIGLDLVSYRMIDVSALLTTILIYAVAVKISLQGYRPARIFLFAWSIFFAGLLLFILRNLGILPYNNYTNYTMEAGIAIEVTLLSIALADKINIFKKEKELSQALALEAARENERIIRGQNVMLEEKVKERTYELSELNEELKTTLTNLQQTQIQLVESEKMASLGQLTAGIAHEINNPINFVTSNIKPLRRDVDIVFESLATIETIGLSEKSPVEKQREIDEYKEEIDFNYLREEISYLFKGIHEGASRTAEIVKGLRVFSRVDEDDLKKADINEGINSTLIIVNNLLNNKIKVVKQFADLPKIECFPGKLNQVFLNIISNAIHAVNSKFKDSEGGEIQITTEFDSGSVSVRIKDNGIGMDEITKKRIFEPFFTTKGVGEGVGLGMSIAYNTIKKHNGKIVINSAPGAGTEFIIQLPLFYTLN
jgi:signal transduction histidine kinase